jgi:hypothetical protein
MQQQNRLIHPLIGPASPIRPNSPIFPSSNSTLTPEIKILFPLPLRLCVFKLFPPNYRSCRR